MKVTLWGTRGSLASPGAETARYGGNTSCVEVRGADGRVLVLDAGTGIRRLGAAWPAGVRRVDLLLTHLHMDHIQGLGFFAPLYDPDMEVHIWGPASTDADAAHAPEPLPVAAALPGPPARPACRLDAARGARAASSPSARSASRSALVCHPGPTVGYRIERGGADASTYLPDHEPALGVPRLSRPRRSGPRATRWPRDVDLLIHDAQYTEAEYARARRLGAQLGRAGAALRRAGARPPSGAVPPRSGAQRRRHRAHLRRGHRRVPAELPGDAGGRRRRVRPRRRGVESPVEGGASSPPIA